MNYRHSESVSYNCHGNDTTERDSTEESEGRGPSHDLELMGKTKRGLLPLHGTKKEEEEEDPLGGHEKEGVVEGCV